MKKFIFAAFLALSFLCFSSTMFAGDPSIYINPGVKLGYTFGEKGGFTWGMEVSATSSLDISGGLPTGGVVLDIDFCKSWIKLHGGLQGSIGLIGAAIGPAVLFEDGKTFFGFSSTLFTGIIVFPYYHYTYFENKHPALNEMGVFIKSSIQVQGTPYRFSLVH